MIKLKTLIFVFLCAFFVSFPGFFKPLDNSGFVAAAENPLDDWSYRKNQTISQTNHAGVNYTILTHVYYNQTPEEEEGPETYLFGSWGSPTFGTDIEDTIRGTAFTSGVAGTLEFIEGQFQFSPTYKTKAGIYYAVNDTLLAESYEYEYSGTGNFKYYFDAEYPINAATSYVICAWANESAAPYAFAHLGRTSPGAGHQKSYNYTANSGSYPDPGALGHSTFMHRIWANVSYVPAPTITNAVGLGAKCNLNFSDVRFVDNDETTVLNYWLENKTDGQESHYWVQIQDSITAGNVLYWIYYGNENAKYIGNGTLTFPFFDSFIADNWNKTGVTVNIDTENERVNYTSSSYGDLEHAYNFPSNYSIDFAISPTLMEAFGVVHIAARDNAGAAYQDYNDAEHTRIHYVNDMMGLEKYENTVHTNYGNNGGALSLNAWYRARITRFGSDISNSVFSDIWLSIVGFQVNGTWAPSDEPNRFCIAVRNFAGANGYIDDFRLRYYTAPEPALSAWGAEESLMVGSPALFWAVLIMLFIGAPGFIIILGESRKWQN